MSTSNTQFVVNMSAKELELARELISHSEAIKKNLVEFFEKSERLVKQAKPAHKALMHQITKQAIGIAQISKLSDAIDTLQKGVLESLPRENALAVGPVAIDGLLIPCYLYEPVKKEGVKLANQDSKTNLADFGKVLKAIVETNHPDAVEKRLATKAFLNHEDLRKACEGLVIMVEENAWSVTKA